VLFRSALSGEATSDWFMEDETPPPVYEPDTFEYEGEAD
jgi:hypothetical protein